MTVIAAGLVIVVTAVFVETTTVSQGVGCGRQNNNQSGQNSVNSIFHLLSPINRNHLVCVIDNTTISRARIAFVFGS